MKNFRRYLMWLAFALLVTLAAIKAMQWLRDHPEHNPAAQFELAHPQGWATHRKLVALVGDGDACFAAFDRAGLSYDRRPLAGQGKCRADQRMTLATKSGATKAGLPTLAPARVAPSCAITAAMLLWNRDVVQRAAQRHFGQAVVRIDNLGSYNCRGIGGGSRPSEHSTANAIDISGFVLEDGTRVSVLKDWKDAEGVKGTFLREVRDASCALFATVLSPDYNRAHADHFHLDQAVRTGNWSLCR